MATTQSQVRKIKEKNQPKSNQLRKITRKVNSTKTIKEVSPNKITNPKERKKISLAREQLKKVMKMTRRLTVRKLATM